MDLWNNPVSASAASNTIQAINFTSDGLAWARIEALSDGLGSVNNKRFVIHNEQGTATTSIRQSRNGATSTPLSDIKVSTASGQGSCIPLTGADGVRVYLSVSSTISASAPWTGLMISTVSCLPFDQPTSQ